MSKSSIHVGLSPSEALRHAGQMGKNALAKISRSSSSLPSISAPNGALPAGEELDAVFRQHPDLFRDTSQPPNDWHDFSKSLSSGVVQTLLIRDQQTTPLLREYLLSDHRLHMCAMAERLGDACRQIRRQSYHVIVLAIHQHMDDMVSLLDLMNSSNPRAKAIAVLEGDAMTHLKQMIHPKVLGYVAAQDAARHLADAVIEVSHGRFTASPAISDTVLRLTSNYLAERPPAMSQTPAAHGANELRAANEHAGSSSFASSAFASSQTPSSLLASSPNSGFGEISGLSRRAKVSTALLSERETGILSLIAGGLSSAEIAEQLAISIPTVNAHVRNIFTKLGVHTRAQAIHVGIAQGMIEVQ
jgi:DNA-binding NarL/FixJ family response regulator